MSNSHETPPSTPPKPAAETAPADLPTPSTPDGDIVLPAEGKPAETSDSSPEPEQLTKKSPSSNIESAFINGMTPEQLEIAERMLKPIQNPAVNTARRQEAKDRELLNPDRNHPVVPHTAAEKTQAEERYDAGWQDPALPPGPEEVAQKEREGLENLKKLVELMDEFELRYPLEELHAITSISLAELGQHPVRKPANIALVYIRKVMAQSPIEKMPELKERYLRLARAVGIYNTLTKTLDHDRG